MDDQISLQQAVTAAERLYTSGDFPQALEQYRSAVFKRLTEVTGHESSWTAADAVVIERLADLAILDGSLRKASFEPDPVFGLPVPDAVPGVPREMLHPRETWSDKAAYDAKAKELAGLFRANDAKYDIDDAVRDAGPK